jgi:hypothetical protein
MGANMTADGSRIRSMEWESTDGLMGLFTKEAMQMTKGMAWVFNGILMAVSIKAIIKIVKNMISILFIIKQLETQLMPNIKMVS